LSLQATKGCSPHLFLVPCSFFDILSMHCFLPLTSVLGERVPSSARLYTILSSNAR
jgi:hypothetical protein